MNEEKEVKQANGLVVGKEECKSKKGDKYAKFHIKLDGEEKDKIFNMFDWEATHSASFDDYVELFWVENQGTGKTGLPIVFRNLNSIAKIDKKQSVLPNQQPTVVKPQPSTVTTPVTDWDKINKEKQLQIQVGMVFNKTIDYIMHRQKVVNDLQMAKVETPDYKLADNFDAVFDQLFALATTKRIKVLGK